MFKKILKWIFISLAALIVLGIVAVLIMDEEIPNGVEGKDADALAMKIYNNLNHKAFQETRILKWSFPGGHHYEWNKNKGQVNVQWGENEVLLDLIDKKDSKIIKPSGPVSDEKRAALIKTAFDYFNNDSFWLVAPYKLFEKGVSRKLVKLENGDSALLVTYASGGSTPGDSYLWIVDTNGRPKSFRMWVSIIPVGGLKASWEQWGKTGSGAMLASRHKILFFNMEIQNISTYN